MLCQRIVANSTAKKSQSRDQTLQRDHLRMQHCMSLGLPALTGLSTSRHLRLIAALHPAADSCNLAGCCRQGMCVQRWRCVQVDRDTPHILQCSKSEPGEAEWLAKSIQQHASGIA